MSFAYLGRTSDSVSVTRTTATHTSEAKPLPRLIAVDWGTTSLRAWLMSDGGEIVSTRRRAKGLLSIADRPAAERGAEYERIFIELCKDWLGEYPTVPAIACGMVGSTEGWADAGYLTVPTDLEFSADTLTKIRHARGTLHLVPGLRVAPHGDTPGDLLRGEESQLVGALELVDSDQLPQTFVLPGTHTKWVRVDNATVQSFTSVMTGEIYGLLLRHGLLARTAATGSPDYRAFDRGLRTTTDRGLLAELFGARALVLDGLLDPASVPDYLSGVLIADEVRHQFPRYGAGAGVVVCGAPDLCNRYARALRQAGADPRIVTEDATARGLWTIAARSGLIDSTIPEAQGGIRA
ncbi:2-dehydro-3-deoxygalactonokinase [Mycolicibacterium sp. P9-64]|nr:2-dehydro-3-deoxygalactonokinase [Mycolicibacterium sp. P9-64]